MSKIIKKRNTSMPIAVMGGVIVSLIVTVVGMMISTQLLNSSRITENMMSFICPVIWFLSSCFGGIAASIIESKNFLLTSTLSATVYFAVLFTLSAMFFEGNYNSIGWGILSVLLGIIPGLFLFLKKSKSAKVKFKLR